jgi:hypothetical protein
MKTSIGALIVLTWIVIPESCLAQESESEPVEETQPAAAEGAAGDVQPATARDMAVEADRVFTLQPHPIFNPEQAQLVYEPLITYLNSATPYQFELSPARDFHRYWIDIRRGVTPDLVLEDAHLTALRIERYDYSPIVKAEEPATFSLLTSNMNADLELDDFIGQPVSVMPSPSLGYLILNSWYDNPMQQPIIQSNATSWLDAIEIVFAMEAEAAMAPHNLVSRYVNMVVLRTSEEFPHATISASPDVPGAVRRAIRDALTVLHEDPDHFGALHELDIDAFVPASFAEYEGLERWLDQVFTFF